MNTLNAQTCALVLVDYQSRLMPAIHQGERALSHACFVADVAQALGIPVLGTEQNPLRLGSNVPAIRQRCHSTLSKTHFDACEDGLLSIVQTARPGVDQVVVAGCEAHVCLLQTAMGLLRSGLGVWVVATACGSRREADHDAAMARLQLAGAVLLTHEMAAFEWLHHCEHPRFREVLALIKSME